MSIAEQVFEKGLREGLKKGRQQGRQEGSLIGQIRLMEEFLGARRTPLNDLNTKSPEELQNLAQDLRRKYRDRSGI